MSKISRGDVLLQFALLSFMAFVALAGFRIWLNGELIADRARASAAAAAVASVSPAVRAQVSGLDLRAPLPDDAREELDARITTAGLISQDVLRLRLWSPSGILVYSTEADEAGMGFLGSGELLEALSGAVPTAVSVNDLPSPRGDLFQIYSVVRSPGAAPVVLEINQLYDPIASAISHSQRIAAFQIVAALALVYGLLQGAFWFATRSLAHQYARLSYLYTTTQQLRASLDLREVMSQLAEDAAGLAQGSYGILILVDEFTGDLVLKSFYDRRNDAVEHYNRKVDEWFLSRPIATGEPLTARLHERPYPTILGFRRGGEAPVPVLSVPMLLRDRATGILLVVRQPGARDFQQAEISPVVELAGQGAMAIEQAALFAKVRAYAGELETSYDTTLKALMAALDTKDAATEGHSERVSRLTVEVAREMGVPENRLLDIERGALLHDVGKIGVPDSVLRKPQALTKKEWEAMQQHPMLAGLMVSKVGFLEGAMPILLYHHERYDGAGYPFGLAGEKIPLEARIFATVDAFDAITSERPYRGASTPREAVAEIQRNAGTQFDPDVVEAFVAVMERRLAEIDAREADETPEAA